MAWIAKEGTISTITMSEAERQNNATEFYNYFYPLGFTVQSICGMLGNIERESWIDPAIRQGDSMALGRGLIQWSPSTDLINWCNARGYDWKDGNAQCELINAEGNKEEGLAGRWHETSAYPYSWAQFSQLEDVAEATKAYLFERERAGVEVIAERIANANKWYEFFTGDPPPPPPPPPHGSRKRMPVYMMIRRRY